MTDITVLVVIIYQAITTGDYIEKNSNIVVIKIEENQLVVKNQNN